MKRIASILFALLLFTQQASAGFLLNSFSVAPGYPNVTYIGTTVDTATATTYTFTSVDIGTASADRLVVVVAGDYDSSGGTLNSVTIAGTAGTLADVENSEDQNCAIYYRTVTSGTTATIVVTLSNSSVNAFISVYTITGLNSITPTGTSSPTAGSTDPTAAINVSEGGAVIGCANEQVSSTVIWTGLPNEDRDAVVESPHYLSVAHAEGLAADATYDITADFSAGGDKIMVVAAWR